MHLLDAATAKAPRQTDKRRASVWPSLLTVCCAVSEGVAFQICPGNPDLKWAATKHEHARHRPAALGHWRSTSHYLQARDKRGDEEALEPTSDDPSLGIKAAWYGSELFGNIIGVMKGGASEASRDDADPTKPIPRPDALARLRKDFDRYYFVTGQMDLDLYEEDCTFADPFVAFQGRQRFKTNLDNLGSLMQDVNLDVTKWEEEDESIKTKWRFRCVLGLPWRPTLAAAGGTEFFFNKDSGRIERHVESWEIAPIDALKQLIRPGRQRQSG